MKYETQVPQSFREITFKIMRYNPHLPGDQARIQEYKLTEALGMTVFIALNMIRENQDPTLQFDFVCRAGICGSCAMMINGEPKLACRTLTATYENGVITLMPMPTFELIADLSVNTGAAMRRMSERIEGWIHDPHQDERDIAKLEEPMDPALAEHIYEFERCIECGACMAACATRRLRKEFLGAAGFMRIARFEADPRDKRSPEEYYDLVGDEEGVFGCMTLLGCEDFCPKELPHQEQIARLRRKMVATAR
ncbi:MAG: fumarate reductase [Candidatus Lambdaproteobacteria bacterium RIFOXYD12_FULL_49_8]|uniref:Fumarate reductase iron-sulfur subunit n=1 Tax=Candidatus Lambdaproteobacteria bacterium RIFOXYD2_FULL_50_16 TaxID=1817772 RepID=A0A1F6G6H0_9PROT|nr:MAG: fumarate reductase [Candidatus Lambdaproteobacteria bacterium RIFOXYD2_FULL_50_16]OGG96521.1 MAG: fumarate reductase [Candidatus Lambdaproteobacteria bacterium RIFOXYD12_FULL_49_8]